MFAQSRNTRTARPFAVECASSRTRSSSGAVLPIDLETTSVVVLAFPPMLMLWKAVQDDGQVSWVETAAMVCVFGIVVYLLAAHG